MAVYPKNLQTYLTDFDNKRRSVRENSLKLLVNALNSKPRHKFVEENHITLCHSFLTRLTSKKKGSNKFSKPEICLAVRAISLLAINIVNQDYAHKVFDECLPVLSDALVRFESEIEVIVEVLNCLGFVGFFCSSISMEIEKTMLVVWDFMIKGSDHKSCVSSAAIRAWLFLLSGVDIHNLNKKQWRKCFSFFLPLLERKTCDCNNDDDVYGEDVVMGAKNALGLIIELDLIENFTDECNEGDDSSQLKQEIIRKIEGISSKGGNLSQNIQVKVMKKFLGKDGFGCHMKENEVFHGLFESMSCNNGKKGVDSEVDQRPEREEVVLKFFRREVERRQDDEDDLLPYVSEKEKNVQYRMGNSANSSLNKARTQLRNKQRKVVNPDFVGSESYD